MPDKPCIAPKAERKCRRSGAVLIAVVGIVGLVSMAILPDLASASSREQATVGSPIATTVMTSRSLGSNGHDADPTSKATSRGSISRSKASDSRPRCGNPSGFPK